VTRKTATQITDNLSDVISDTQGTMKTASVTSDKITDNLQLALDTHEAFTKIKETFHVLKEDISKYDTLTTDVLNSSKSIEVSINEFSSVIEQASASLQELSSTVGLQTSQHEMLLGSAIEAFQSVENLKQLQQK